MLRKTYSGTTSAWILPWVVLILAACSAKSNQDGSCKLECGGAVVGAANFLVKGPGSGGESTVSCASPAAATLELHFLIVEDTQGTGTQAGTTSTTTDSAQAQPSRSPVEPQKDRYIPRSGIAFKPMIFGGSSQTSASDFCSDSCGVATVVVSAACPAASKTSTVTVGIMAGGAASDSSYKIKLDGG